MNIKELYRLYIENYLVDTDTRNIRQDSIFFCLKGKSFNGNHFAGKAIEKGARYSVIDEEEYEIKGKTIFVDDVLKTLQELSNYHRKQLAIPIIGITGSNGKTTTKELINAVLKTQYNTYATHGNLNNHIGVPLTLLSFTNTTEIGIVEMGANHQKEIEFLCHICEPTIGYITNFGKAHLEGFGGVDGVIKGKAELYKYLKKKNNIAFVNSNDSKQLELTRDITRFFLNNNVNVASLQPFLELHYKNQTIKTQLTGTYNLDNIKAAVSIGEYFKIQKKNIISALNSYIPTNNRSQIIERSNNKILLDAYNANPTSTKLALKNFYEIKHPNKVAILGDMFELGKESIKEHQDIVNFCETLSINRIIFVGKNYCQTTAKEKYVDRMSLKKIIMEHPFKNNFILLKGSRGMALEKILEVIN